MTITQKIEAIEKELDNEWLGWMHDTEVALDETKNFYRTHLLSLIPKIAEALTPELSNEVDREKDDSWREHDEAYNSCISEINRRKDILLK